MVASVDPGHIDCSDVAIEYSPNSVRFPGSILGAVFARALKEPTAQYAAGYTILTHYEAGRRLQLHDLAGENAPTSPHCSLARLALSGAFGIERRHVEDILAYTQHLAVERGWAIPEPAELRQSIMPDAVVVVDSDQYTVLPASPGQTLLRVDRAAYLNNVLKPLADPDDQCEAVALEAATNKQIDAVANVLHDVPRYEISL